MGIKCGIYKVTINNKVYIGQAINLNKREKGHLRELNKNTHYNLHLQRTYNKYGHFKFEVIEECSKELLDEREIHYIKEYDSIDNGYNLQTGGRCGGYVLVGHPREDEIRKTMSEAQKRKPKPTEETKRKIREAAIGRTHSKETKRKMSIDRKGKRAGKENPMFGRKMTEQQKTLRSQISKKYWENVSDEDLKARNKKISEANKGKVVSDEGRKNMSKAQMGKVPWNKGKKDIYSEETRKKMGESKIGIPSPLKKKCTKKEIIEVCLREGDVTAASKVLGYHGNGLRRRLIECENIIPIYDRNPFAKEAKIIGFEDLSLSANPNNKIEGFMGGVTKVRKYTIDEIKEACLKEGTQTLAAKSLGFRSITPIGSRLKRAGINIIYETTSKLKIIGFEDLNRQ